MVEKQLSSRDQTIPKLREVFREYGYEGTSLSEITHQTGLGKGSLYHLFPKGKTEMAVAVLHDIDQWFESHVFKPLRKCEDPVAGIRLMFKEVKSILSSGRSNLFSWRLRSRQYP